MMPMFTLDAVDFIALGIVALGCFCLGFYLSMYLPRSKVRKYLPKKEIK